MAEVVKDSIIDQVQKFNDQMAKYNSDKSKFVDGGGAFPNLEDYIGGLDYSEIHRFTSMSQTGSANTASGAAIDTVHQICAVQRETGMRYKRKSVIYSDGAIEARGDSDYYSIQKVAHVNMLQGKNQS